MHRVVCLSVCEGVDVVFLWIIMSLMKILG